MASPVEQLQAMAGFLYLNRSTGHVETRKLVASRPSVVHPGFLRELKLLLAA